MTDLSQYVLYSGGLKGTEAAFGECAEKWGIKEVNFTFVGHEMERVKNVKFLTEEDLRRGDVSMEIVCQRMGRTYTNANKIRRVMQSIFHMVNSGYQVFAVGIIKDDGTVKGGTGWGVELAKFFNRPVCVFDQDRKQWFAWQDKGWVPAQALIEHKSFVGTGTRNLTAEGRKAIEDLFERSFGTPALKE